MKIVVAFPGMGYTCDRPLLYYSIKLALAAGYDEVVKLEYHDLPKNIMKDAELKMKAYNMALSQSIERLEGIDWYKYDDILFISKSMGTIVASEYARKHNINCKNIYYTPLEETFQHQPKNGVAFTGTLDPWVETSILRKKCEEINMPLYVYGNANHSLETGDVLENLDILKDIMIRTKGTMTVV